MKRTLLHIYFLPGHACMVPLALAFFLGVFEKTKILKPMNTIIMQIALSTMIRFIQRIEQAVIIIIIIIVVLPSCINITSISLAHD
jgi:hypothetical protein